MDNAWSLWAAYYFFFAPFCSVNPHKGSPCFRKSDSGYLLQTQQFLQLKPTQSLDKIQFSKSQKWCSHSYKLDKLYRVDFTECKFVVFSFDFFLLLAIESDAERGEESLHSITLWHIVFNRGFNHEFLPRIKNHSSDL